MIKYVKYVKFDRMIFWLKQIIPKNHVVIVKVQANLMVRFVQYVKEKTHLW